MENGTETAVGEVIAKLQEIKGIGISYAKVLYKAGIRSFQDFSQYSSAQDLQQMIAEKTGIHIPVVKIEKEKWLGQAKIKAEGKGISSDSGILRQDKHAQDIVLKVNWPQHAGFSIFFDCKNNIGNGDEWRARTYHDESGDEGFFEGVAMAPWIDWILERANLPIQAESTSDNPSTSLALKTLETRDADQQTQPQEISPMTDLKPFPVDMTGITHAIIEMFGGDNNLNDYVDEDLQEMAAGNAGNFAVIALADYVDDAGKVMVLLPGKPFHTVESLGEIDTGDPDTLATFLARALVTVKDVPHKAIGFWDHGSGVFDEHDPDETHLERGRRRLTVMPRHLRSRSIPGRRLFVSPNRFIAQPRIRAMLHDQTNGGLLTNHEAHGVLKAAFSRAGQTGGKVDLIFSDTCLNGMIEVLEQMAEFTHVVVGSEDLEPGDGWEYREWFQRMSAAPPADAFAWGQQAVAAFESGYASDTQSHPCTLAAFKTGTALTASMGELVRALDQCNFESMRWVKLAIADTQSFAGYDSFDIHDFARKLQDIAGSSQVASACGRVMAAIADACVHSVALGDQVSNAHGLAFWFPNRLYDYGNVMETYRKLVYDQKTGWSDYLGKYRFSAPMPFPDIPPEVPAPAPVSPPIEVPPVSVGIRDVQLSRASQSHLRVTTSFELKGEAAAGLTNARAPFSIEIRVVNTVTGAPEQMVSVAGGLESGITTYNRHAEFPLPGHGAYELKTRLSITPASGNSLVDERVGPGFQVTA